MNIKIRYTFRRKLDGHIYKKGEMYQICQPIEEIEKGPASNFVNEIWELVARDLFTGLTDRNGVEIYLNDIVNGPFATGLGGVSTKYKNFNSLVGFYPEQGYTLLNNKTHEDRYRFLPAFSQLSVIGNIHTNPELLEVK